MSRDFDLVILGGGSGGLAAAFRAATHGARVALVSEGPLGGTCVNVGCVPKKAMWLAADLAHRMALARALGFDVPQTPALDWPVLIAHRQRYIANIHASYQQRLDAAGIALLPVRGRLLSPDTVQCSDGVRLRAPHVLIATGGRPQRPSVPGAELGIDSDGFFHLCAAPERVAIIGGGYVAVELAGVLQALGSQVDMFVRKPMLLDGFDEDIVRQLVEDQRQHGIHCHFDQTLGSLRKADGDRVILRDAAGVDTVPFDVVILATGRRPNSDDIGLDVAGVALGPRGHVLVDARQATSVAGVYAIGDVSSDIALTPVAIAAGRRLMDRLFGGQPDAALDYSQVATVVFSHPPIGKVGLTEAQARLRFGDAVRVYRAGFRPMLHALADSPQRSLFKLVCVGEEERVVGIHLLGDGADEILQGFAVALKRGLRKRDLDDTIAIHPTSAEELVLMR
ncbi:glutathione-disulfide reductase [Cognatiluteimonas profundi]|uniref:glutathione-disulfide reductase n=1 Tax=Cognatiluteimonas profundi TaxID=2594501 RepID=UPI00131CBFBE|nr:glutathione-disulfide reductase [Lysobacter profundi]